MDDSYMVIKCPHCHEYIIIYNQDINCHIFRHAIYRSNYQQINPHMSNNEADDLFQKGLIYGCGTQFCK